MWKTSNKTWANLNRHWRNKYLIEVKNEIRKQAQKDRLFCSPEVMLDDLDPDNAEYLKSGYSRPHMSHCCYFLSKTGKAFYNANITNLAYRYYWIVNDAALDIYEQRHGDLMAYNIFDEKFNSVENGMSVTRIPTELMEKQKRNHVKLEEICLELVEGNTFEVYEEVTLHRDYRFGVGLHVALNCEEIEKDEINRFIEAFRGIGEKPFKGNEPFSMTVEDFKNTFCHFMNKN